MVRLGGTYGIGATVPYVEPLGISTLQVGRYHFHKMTGATGTNSILPDHHIRPNGQMVRCPP